jgi:putative phosphoesterase
MRVALISDTHGQLRPEALAFVRGADHIVHAGDICDPAILDALAELAPLTAVRGNNDHGAWAERLPATALVPLGGILLYAIHDLAEIDLDPPAAGVAVVVSGHSHIPVVQQRDGVVYVNPGSAGPRRFRLPISVGELDVRDGTVTARTVSLETAAR